MDELLKLRIERAIEGLPDEKVRQVLDYAEFLQSKYGDRAPSTIERLANGVEDTMRVGRVPLSAIKGTREVFNTAERVMKGLADAGRSVVDEIQEQIREAPQKGSGEAGEDTEAATGDGDRGPDHSDETPLPPTA